MHIDIHQTAQHPLHQLGQFWPVRQGRRWPRQAADQQGVSVRGSQGHRDEAARSRYRQMVSALFLTWREKHRSTLMTAHGLDGGTRRSSTRRGAGGNSSPPLWRSSLGRGSAAFLSQARNLRANGARLPMRSSKPTPPMKPIPLRPRMANHGRHSTNKISA
jgi:hypothetical protein